MSEAENLAIQIQIDINKRAEKLGEERSKLRKMEQKLERLNSDEPEKERVKAHLDLAKDALKGVVNRATGGSLNNPVSGAKAVDDAANILTSMKDAAKAGHDAAMAPFEQQELVKGTAEHEKIVSDLEKDLAARRALGAVLVQGARAAETASAEKDKQAKKEREAQQQRENEKRAQDAREQSKRIEQERINRQIEKSTPMRIDPGKIDMFKPNGTLVA